MGGSGIDIGNSITLDGFGNIYTTGNFENTADFDPGAGAFNLSSSGLYDIFISKLDPLGNFAWAKRIGGTGFDMGTSLFVDVSGNIYTTGQFQGTVDFDPDAGIFNLTSTAGSSDIFVHKMSQSPVTPVSFGVLNAACNNEKVSVSWSTLQELNSSRFDIEKSANGTEWKVTGTLPAAGNSSIEKTYQFSDYAPVAGISYYRIAEYDLDGKVKYSAVIKIQCDDIDEIKLLPNPVQEIAWILINTQMPVPVELNLFDSKGALVLVQKKSIDRGASKIPIRLDGFANGIYELKVRTGSSGVKAFKLLKQSN